MYIMKDWYKYKSFLVVNFLFIVEEFVDIQSDNDMTLDKWWEFVFTIRNRSYRKRFSENPITITREDFVDSAIFKKNEKIGI